MRSLLIQNLLIDVIILCSYVQLSICGFRNQEHQEISQLNNDRIYSPPTPLMCFLPEFLSLKSCILARMDPYFLGRLSSKYLNRQVNMWRYKHEQSIQSKNARVGDRTQFQLTPNQIELNSNTRHPNKLKPINPCTKGVAKKTIIFFATDADTGERLELVHDPYNGLYQTFYTESCKQKRIYGFECAKQYAMFSAPVFIPGSYEVGVRPVKIAMNCALTTSGNR